MTDQYCLISAPFVILAMYLSRVVSSMLRPKHFLQNVLMFAFFTVSSVVMLPLLERTCPSCEQLTPVDPIGPMCMIPVDVFLIARVIVVTLPSEKLIVTVHVAGVLMLLFTAVSM